MKSELFGPLPMPTATIAGLLVFFAVFLSVLFWVMRPEKKATYEKIQNFPLNEDN